MRLLVALAVSLALLTVTAANGAEDEKKAPTEAQKAQQDKVPGCDAEAKARALKGDERKQFMSGCLSSGQAQKPTAEQQKLVECNRKADGQALKGDKRMAFMSSCLKG